MAYKITDKCNGCGACRTVCPTDAITGKKKATHLIADDKCIECGACGRICAQGAVLDETGQICKMIKKSLWPKPVFIHKTCMSCGICISACPSVCLGFGHSEEGSNTELYPVLENGGRCIGCSLCAYECPVDSIVMTATAVQANISPNVPSRSK